MPMLKARERLKELEAINASNIYEVHYTAFEDNEAALRIQDRWIMQETIDKSRNS
jgi:hypothetical protein